MDFKNLPYRSIYRDIYFIISYIQSIYRHYHIINLVQAYTISYILQVQELTIYTSYIHTLYYYLHILTTGIIYIILLSYRDILLTIHISSLSYPFIPLSFPSLSPSPGPWPTTREKGDEEWTFPLTARSLVPSFSLFTHSLHYARRAPFGSEWRVKERPMERQSPAWASERKWKRKSLVTAGKNWTMMVIIWKMNRVNHARLCRSVPVTHILTLSGRSLQSQPFHRESFYVTGTPPLLTLLAHSSRPSSREPRSAAERLPSARRKVRRGMRDV